MHTCVGMLSSPITCIIRSAVWESKRVASVNFFVSFYQLDIIIPATFINSKNSLVGHV